MKKKDVEIGERYVAKVSGNEVPIQILRESRYGGWDAKNLKTGRMIRVKTAARLRRRYRPVVIQPAAPISPVRELFV